MLGTDLAQTIAILAKSGSADPIGRLCDVYGVGRREAAIRLRTDDRRLSEIAGFGLLAGEEWDDDGSTTARTSDQVRALGDGRIRFERVNPTAATPLDTRTEAWFALLRAAVGRREGCHVLYRLGKADAYGISPLQAEVVGRLSHLAGPSEVAICRTKRVNQTDLPTLILIAAALTFKTATIVVTPAPEALFDMQTSHVDDDVGELSENASRAGTRMRPLRSDAWRRTRHVHLWCGPSDVALPREGTPLIGAFGPGLVAVDGAIDDLRRQAPKGADDGVLRSLLQTTGSAANAERIIALSKQLAPSIGASPSDLIAMLATSLRGHAARPVVARIGATFDRRLVNADCDVVRLLERAPRLARAGARILLHGVPGGGKSLLATGLADAMGRQVRSVRGGDVYFSKWGATERAIWSILHEASQSGDVVVLEEVESLIANRSDRSTTGSNRSMTITATNEWLAALDQHAEPLIATTNAIDDVDEAARRRFHVVVELLPLRPDQEAYAWRRLLKIDKPPAWWVHCGVAVVADFGTASDRMRLFGERGPEAAAAALRSAIKAREGSAAKRRKIGFLGL